MISNYYNDSLLRRYTSSTNASDTQIFYNCFTNNVLMPEGKSLGCINHVVMKCFKHNRDNTNKSQVTLIVHVHECEHVQNMFDLHMGSTCANVWSILIHIILIISIIIMLEY